VLRCACRLRARLGQRKLLGRSTLRRSPPTQLRSTALAHFLRDSFVRARAAGPVIPDPAAARRGGALCQLGGHDVAEAQPALILVDGAPDVLAVHVVQQTVNGLRAGRVADEARYEVVHERGVV